MPQTKKRAFLRSPFMEGFVRSFAPGLLPEPPRRRPDTSDEAVARAMAKAWRQVGDGLRDAIDQEKRRNPLPH